VATLCQRFRTRKYSSGSLQLRQRSLAVEEREIAKIAAIVLDQIEGIKHRTTRCLSAAQLIEA
jgi:hypothetical protein